jgi:signal transduction histidine kinase
VTAGGTGVTVPAPGAPTRAPGAGRPTRWQQAVGWLSEQPATPVGTDGMVVAGTAATPRWVAAAATAHPYVVDTAIAVVVAAATTPWLVRTRDHHVSSWAFQVLLILPLVWRRRAPVTVFAALSLVALAQWVGSVKLPADVTLLVALYAVAVHRPRRLAVLAAAVLEVGVVLAILRWSPVGGWFRSLVFLSGLVAAALLLGSNIRARRAHLSVLTERAARLEHERDQQARIAADAERTRIAREMHDVLAHSLAVMITLADGAAAKLRREPERAADAISQVSALGRQSLDDTRRLLGVLRAEGDGGPAGTDGSLTAPQPGVDQLEDLIAGVRATGLEASLAVRGRPFVLAPGAGLALYRIVQEACTNTLKHASGARRLRVRVSYSDPMVEVDVVDDGAPQAVPAAPARNLVISHANQPDPPAPATTPRLPGPVAVSVGHGLAGMRERAAVYRGDVDAGPVPHGGWRVHAQLLVGAGGAG